MGYTIKIRGNSYECNSPFEIEGVLSTFGISENDKETILEWVENAEIGEVYEDGFEGICIIRNF
mgnify:CR=1 FL=1